MLLTLFAVWASEGPKITIEDQLSSPSKAAWIVYAAQLVESAEARGSFEEEHAARTSMVQMWRELSSIKPKRRKRRGIDLDDPYLNLLQAVDDAHFLREYTWVHLRDPAWDRPDALRLTTFREWSAVHLPPNHEAQTHVVLSGLPAATSKATPLVEAELAYRAGHLARAASLASSHLAVDPDDPQARWTRAMALYDEGRLVAGSERRRLNALASQDLNHLIRTHPDSSLAALAVQIFGSGPALRLPRYACEAGQSALQEGARAYAAKDMPSARNAYQSALEHCPGHATAWVYLGDTYFHEGALSPAKKAYARAIALEPCHWMAQRFLADLLSRTDEPQTTIRSLLIQSLSCNPSYTAGWSIESYMDRYDVQRPKWVEGQATLQVATDPLSEPWRQALQDAGNTQQPDLHLRALASAVETYQTSATPEASPFWDHMVRAKEAGLLREALFIHLYGDDLKTDFLLHRSEHRDDLVRYLDTLGVR